VTPIRLAYIVAHQVRLAYRRLFRVRTRGVKAVVLRGDEVLLIRHSYFASDRFMLPGGGIGRGESALEAGVREVMEETGCRLIDQREHGVFVSRMEGFTDEITVITGTTTDTPQADGRELLEASFFPLNTLPLALTGPSLRRVVEVRDGLEPSREW